MVKDNKSIMDGVVLFVLSFLFTAVAYYLCLDKVGLKFGQFPDMLVAIYLGMALYCFPKVAPRDYKHRQMVTTKLVYPLYYLVSPIIFIYQLLITER